MTRRRLLLLAALAAPAAVHAQQPAIARARGAVAQANASAAQRGAIPAAQPAPVARSASPAAAPGAAPAVAPAIAAAGGIATGHAAGAIDSSVAGALTFRREVFAFEKGDRRDPFVSLMTTGALRPVISDLVLTGVAWSADAGRSVAVFRDKQTKEQYRVKSGDQLGRMRVYRIEPRRVTFAIDEFGFNRQESINMGDTTRVSLTQQTTTRTGTP